MVANAYDALLVLTIISVMATIGAAFNKSTKVFTRVCCITLVLSILTVLISTKV